MAKLPSHKMTDRELEIAQHIRGACTKIAETLADKADAMESVQNLAASEVHGRVAVILEIADMASSQNWTESEVTWACSHAAKVKGNDERTSKSIATFCSEMKNVASVRVRLHVPAIYEHVKQAWDIETDMLVEDKDAPKPLRKFAKRFYHLFTDAIRKTKTGEIWLTSAADVVTWAEANDPDLNAGTVADQIARIADQLADMFKNFAHSDLQDCAVALGALNQQALTATRVHPDLTTTLPKRPQTAAQALSPVAAPPTPPQPLAAVQPAPRPVSVPISEPVIDAVSDIDDVSDLLDPEDEAIAELAEAAD